MFASLKYYWLFYFIFIIFISLSFFEKQWIWYFLTIICAGRILWMGNNFRWILFFLSIFFCWRMLILDIDLTARQQLSEHSNGQVCLQVDPHDVTLTESMIHGEGKVILADRIIPVQWFSYELDIVESFQSQAIHRVEEWQVTGEIQEISGALNFHVFDYQTFLAKKGIFYSIEIQELLHREPHQNLWAKWKNLSYQLKLPLMHHDNMWVHLHNRLLYRLDNAVIDDFMDLMSVWGVVHLFSISGIQVHWLRKKGVHLLAWAGIRLDKAQWIIEIMLFIYACVIGWPIGILRALTTHYLRLMTNTFHWPFSRLDQIALVGLTLLFVNPLQLYSLGFQLSFGLTLMIHLFIHQYPDFRELSPSKQQTLLTGLSMLIVWPVMMRLTHKWYPLQFIMSLTISYFFTDYLLGIMIITSVMIYSKLSFFELVLRLLADGLIFIYEWFNYFNPIYLFERTTGYISSISLILLIGCSVFYLYRIGNFPRQTIGIITLIYIFVLFIMPHTSSDAIITILYVGQGDAMLIQWPYQKETWLIDTGGRMSWGTEEGGILDNGEANRYLIPALKALGVNQLTGVLITHPDIDHMGNLIGLVDAIPVKQIYLTKYTAESDLFKEYYAILKDITPQTKYQIVSTERPQTIVRGTLEVLAQDPKDIYLDDDLSNRTSIISAIRFYGRTVLSLGDITSVEEKKYLNHFKFLQPDMVKLAHHGSHTATSPHLLTEIEAEWAFISAGQNNRYGHPHPEVLERLKESSYRYLSTSDVGAIQIRIRPDGKYTINVRQNPKKSSISN